MKIFFCSYVTSLVKTLQRFSIKIKIETMFNVIFSNKTVKKILKLTNIFVIKIIVFLFIIIALKKCISFNPLEPEVTEYLYDIHQ